jgi:hypothetical protein
MTGKGARNDNALDSRAATVTLNAVKGLSERMQ